MAWGVATPVLNLAGYTTAELTALLTAAKAAMLAKITGVVQQGSSSAQSYSLQLMSVDELTRLINALTDQLGYEDPTVRVEPNFNTTGQPFPSSTTF